MHIIVNCILLFLFSVIVFQDFKFRAISWYVLPVMIALLFYKGILVSQYGLLVKYLLFNMSFIIIQFLGLTIYMSLKNKRIVNIVDNYIGLGDLFLFVVLCVAFSPLNFITFFIASTLMTLIFFISFNFFFKKKIVEIPLAGAQSFMFLGLLLFDLFVSPVGFYRDDFFLSILNLQ